MYQTNFHSVISLNQNPRRLFSQIERRDAGGAEDIANELEQRMLLKGQLRETAEIVS